MGVGHVSIRSVSSPPRAGCTNVVNRVGSGHLAIGVKMMAFELIREDDQAGNAEAGEDELGNAIGCDLVGLAYIDHCVTDGYPLQTQRDECDGGSTPIRLHASSDRLRITGLTPGSISYGPTRLTRGERTHLM